MKCANCGKEFGNGVNCQNCGIDRVAGLANYSGFDSHAGSNNYDSSSYGGQTSQKTTVCYACNEIIPIGATYCPVCGRQLWVECPNCGSTYSTQYKICSKCGTNREVYYKQKEAEEQRAIREEEERQRQQREWEQSPEGKATIAEWNAEWKRRDEIDKKISYLIMFILFSVFGIPFLLLILRVAGAF